MTRCPVPGANGPAISAPTSDTPSVDCSAAIPALPSCATWVASAAENNGPIIATASQKGSGCRPRRRDQRHAHHTHGQPRHPAPGQPVDPQRQRDGKGDQHVETHGGAVRTKPLPRKAETAPGAAAPTTSCQKINPNGWWPVTVAILPTAWVDPQPMPRITTTRTGTYRRLATPASSRAGTALDAATAVTSLTAPPLPADRQPGPSGPGWPARCGRPSRQTPPTASPRRWLVRTATWPCR